MRKIYRVVHKYPLRPHNVSVKWGVKQSQMLTNYQTVTLGALFNQEHKNTYGLNHETPTICVHVLMMSFLQFAGEVLRLIVDLCY